MPIRYFSKTDLDGLIHTHIQPSDLLMGIRDRLVVISLEVLPSLPLDQNVVVGLNFNCALNEVWRVPVEARLRSAKPADRTPSQLVMGFTLADSWTLERVSKSKIIVNELAVYGGNNGFSGNTTPLINEYLQCVLDTARIEAGP